jgi:hypothetical protein
MKRIWIVSLLLLAGLTAALAQETITEPSTEKSFPATVTFKADGKDYSLKATGVAVRKKVIIKVYGMIHYMQDPPGAGSRDAIFRAVLTDGKAKQITMNFSRDVTPEQITGAYRDGFAENATKEELKSIQASLDKFLGYFTQPVKENDVFTLRWIPGGTIVPVIYGKDQEPISNPLFAKVLWSIWFGEDSIVDREDLVARIPEK